MGALLVESGHREVDDVESDQDERWRDGRDLALRRRVASIARADVRAEVEDEHAVIGSSPSVERARAWRAKCSRSSSSMSIGAFAVMAPVRACAGAQVIEARAVGQGDLAVEALFARQRRPRSESSHGELDDAASEPQAE